MKIAGSRRALQIAAAAVACTAFAAAPRTVEAGEEDDLQREIDTQRGSVLDLDRLDEFMDSYAWAASKLSLKPSEYFRRQCVISFDPGERSAGAMARLAGAENLIWASDFPHSDAKYPGVVGELRENTADMTHAEREALYGRNALRLYGIESRVAMRAAV